LLCSHFQQVIRRLISTCRGSLCCTIGADDEAYKSSESTITSEEPLSAANIVEKLQNEFVIAIVNYRYRSSRGSVVTSAVLKSVVEAIESYLVNTGLNSAVIHMCGSVAEWLGRWTCDQ